jgi:hypothetical protein
VRTVVFTPTDVEMKDTWKGAVFRSATLYRTAPSRSSVSSLA